MATDKQTFYVTGMHCRSCETLIENRIREFKGVKNVKASTTKGRVDVESHRNTFDLNKLNSVFKDSGYTFSLEQKSKLADLINAALIILLVWSINYAFGFQKIFPVINIGSSTSIGSMFFLGLAAGVSSCAALSGALILSLIKKWKSKGVAGSFLFVTGRIVSYTIAGALLGLVGTLFVISQPVLTIFTILILVFMIILALQMLGYGIFSVFQPNNPKFFDKETDVTDQSSYKKTLFGGFLLGMSTVLLPCGFTLTAAGFAASLAKPLQSSLIMLLFALGSSIVLFIIGVTGHKLISSPKVGDIVSKVVGVLILFFAINTISTQVSISNFFVKAENPNSNQAVTATLSKDVQIIKMDASTSGYSPDNFKVKVNQPVRWEITDKGTSGCTNAVISPGLFEGQIRLTSGQTSIKDFTPTRTGVFRFSCWMGMIKGTIEVTN